MEEPGARLTGALLHDWQRRNHEASLPLALRQMEAAGNLGNLRLAIGRRQRGLPRPGVHGLRPLQDPGGDRLGACPRPVAALAEFAADAVALLEKAQQPDGYLNSYVQVSGTTRYARLSTSHEMYCAGHLIQAAIAHARAQQSQGPPLLGVARAVRRPAGRLLRRP